MIKRIILISIAVFSLSAYCQEAPKEVKEAIDRDLPGILKDVFEKGTKTEWDFSPEDSLDQITVSEPFRVRMITRKDFQTLLTSPSVKSINSSSDTVNKNYTWNACVNANGVGKWLIDVRKENGNWTVNGWGVDYRADDFNKLFKVYDKKDIVLFWNTFLNHNYYYIKSKGDSNLTVIDHEKLNLLSKNADVAEIRNALGKETSVLDAANNAITKFNERKRRNNELH